MCGKCRLQGFYFLLFGGGARGVCAPVAYEVSQARGQIRDVAAGHSHSHSGSEPGL